MGVFDLFFKRKKRLERGDKPVFYQYEDLPEAFRVQVAHIWRSAIGLYETGDYAGYSPTASAPIWRSIENILSRELGVPSLSNREEKPNLRCVRFLHQEPDVAKVLSIIELSFRMIEKAVRRLSHDEKEAAQISQSANGAVEELNHRFTQNGIGYQYVNCQIVRIDSQYLHAEAVKPALSLLHGTGFTGAEEEFLNAHKHYREEEYKEAITDALKAFESTMKSICDKRGWQYPKKATAKPLLETIFANKLIPNELQSHLSALRSVLESGLPTVRNTATPSAHGQGSVPVEVADYMAAYALHLAASNIVFLVEAHKAK